MAIPRVSQSAMAVVRQGTSRKNVHIPVTRETPHGSILFSMQIIGGLAACGDQGLLDLSLLTWITQQDEWDPELLSWSPTPTPSVLRRYGWP